MINCLDYIFIYILQMIKTLIERQFFLVKYAIILRLGQIGFLTDHILSRIRFVVISVIHVL